MIGIIFLLSVHVLSLVELLFGSNRFGPNVFVCCAMMAIVIATKRKAHPHLVTGAGVFVIVLAVGLTVSALVIDTTYDGVRYHAAGVVAIHDSYNFLHERFPTGELGLAYAKWVGIYPKLAWVLGANFFSATGAYETAKTPNWIGLLITFGLAFSLFQTLRISQVRNWLLSGLLAFNPVSVPQLLGVRQDCLFSSLLIGLACVLVRLVLMPYRSLSAAAAMLVILVINLKTTGFVYAGMFVGSAFLWSAMRKLPLRSYFASVLAVPFGFFVIGYAPFTQALIQTGNPLNGVVGPGAEILVDAMLPPGFRGRGRLDQFASSLFGRTAIWPQDAELKVPGLVSAAEIRGINDGSRIGGFGPLFSLALVLSLAGATGDAVRRRSMAPALLWLLVTLLASSLINPGAWRARWIPQFFLVPLVCLVIGETGGGTASRLRFLWHAVLVALIANLGLFSYAIARQIVFSERMHAQIGAICARAQTGRLIIYDRLCDNVKGPVLVRARVQAGSAREPAPAVKTEVLADVVFSSQ